MVEGFVFAGYLLYYLARNHCFVDGNKRAAWMATVEVLLSLGLSVDADDDDAEGMVVAVATGEIGSGGEVVQWFAERIIPIPPQLP
jgi:death-on-curing protein